jgi:hypothetical protein
VNRHCLTHHSFYKQTIDEVIRIRPPNNRYANLKSKDKDVESSTLRQVVAPPLPRVVRVLSAPGPSRLAYAWQLSL